MAQLDDAQILRLLHLHSDDAVSAAEKKYRRLCFEIAFNILRNYEDAEECVNDVLLKLWQEPPTQQSTNLKAYISKLARNRAIDVYKRRTALKRGGGQVPMIVEELSECLPAGRGGDPVDDIALRELLSRFVSSLPAFDRRMFVSRYWYSRSIDEVARSLGMSSGKVKMKLARMRKKLKKLLEKEGVEV